MHASVVLEAGADLLFGINPLVPFDASDGGSRKREVDLTDYGLLVVLGQTLRSLVQSRMLVGMAAYKDRFPRAKILLLEPDRADRRMFFANMFRYSDRRRLVNHAYQSTRRDLLRRRDKLAPLLASHGLRLLPEALKDPARSFEAALEGQRKQDRRVVRELSSALDRLEVLLAGAHG